jgi:REP element-mobilizing transposase RayT
MYAKYSVLIPKYRRKIMYGETKRDLVEIIKKLCAMKQVELVDGRVCKDHIHMYVAIPPRLGVSEFMSYLKGKSTLMLLNPCTSKISEIFPILQNPLPLLYQALTKIGLLPIIFIVLQPLYSKL